jgi:phosphoribosylaminoimidazole carboxylase PurE protein
MSEPLVGVLMGSDSDWPVMRETVIVLKELGVPCEAAVLSAHRTPERVAAYARAASERGLKVLIAGAGCAAHLAGAVAAASSLPVIGVPMASSELNGVDALYATVQMPAGVPVATMAIGKAGARNAGILAAQILALSDTGVRERVAALRARLKDAVAEKSQRVEEEAKKIQES